MLAGNIENYLGYTSIPGPQLMEKFLEHTQAYNVQIRNELVKQLSFLGGVFKVMTERGEEQAKTLILAMGASYKSLGVPGEKELLGKGVSYCANCLLPGEEVVANGSLKKIDEIGIIQRVLTADGSFQNINQIISRDYNGEITKIKTRFFTEPVRLTSNHPVLSTKVKRDYYRQIFTTDKLEWKEAGSLANGDILLYPIITETQDKKKIRFSEILGVEVKKGKARNNQETHTSRRIDDEISVNEKFLRLAGYYLAEGCVTRHGIGFFFNKKEKEYINDVKNLVGDLFSLEVNLKIDGGVMRIEVFSKLIRDLFHLLFGKYAPNKKIPHWMLFLPSKKQREIIKGLYRGDGCLRDKDFCIVTTSRTLAYQTRDILLRFGIIPSIVKREKEKLNKLSGEIGGRKIRFNHDKYHIVVGGASLEKMSEILGVHHPKLTKRKTVCRHAWIKDNYLYLPIREIERESYKGRVYNLAVDKNNSYIAKNFIVHNCDAPFFKDKTVAVVGGSNAAVGGALHVAAFASKIYLIHRRDEFRAVPYLVEKMKQNPKIEQVLSTQITQILGTNKVEGVVLDKPYQGQTKLVVDGIFIEIGQVPATALAGELGVKLDEQGFIEVSPAMQTNIPGVFAAGDLSVVPGEQALRQLITAAADGARAAASAYQYLHRANPVPSWGK